MVYIMVYSKLLLMLKQYLKKKNPELHKLVDFVIVKGETSVFCRIFRPLFQTTEKPSLCKWLINLKVATYMVKVVKCFKNAFGISLLRGDIKMTIEITCTNTFSIV